MHQLTAYKSVTRYLRVFALAVVLVAGIAATIASKTGDNTVVDRPWAIDKTFSIEQERVLEFDVATFGLDDVGFIVNDLGEEPSIVTVTPASHGDAVINDVQNNPTIITYTPNAGFLGPDSFTYTITDSNNNSDSGTITVIVTELMPSPRQIAIDTVNNRALVTDDFLRAVVAVDLATGARIYLSDATTPDASNPFSAPNGITIDPDPANNRALVTDIFLDAVIAIDLSTGARTVLSDATTPDASNAFISPDGIVVDQVIDPVSNQANNRALVVDSGLDAIVAVDLNTGARTILSGATIPNAMNPFSAPTGIAIDAANNRALVTDRALAAVIAVDLTTGERTIFSAATIPDSTNRFTTPDGIVVDAANNRALVVERSQTAVLAVDLTTGVRTLISTAFFPDSKNNFISPGAIALDGANERALVIDAELASVIAVSLAGDNDSDPDTRAGQRTFLPETTPLLTENQLNLPHGIAIDAANNRALVTDSVLNALVAVDSLTGARTIFSDATIPSGDNPFDGPVSVVVDTVNGSALVVDQLLGAVLAVDLITGARTILSAATTPNEQNQFDTPGAIALDISNSRVLVTDKGLNAVIAVDLVTGGREILSNADIPDADNSWVVPDAIVIDVVHDRALVVDQGLRAVLAVDLITGARTILSAAGTPDDSNLFSFPTGIYIDADATKNRALVLDSILRSVVAVDLTTGARTILSDRATGAGSGLVLPLGITAGFSTGQVLILDQSMRAVYAVSGSDGDRAIESR